MMKEIHEQPKAVADTLNSVLKNGAIDLTEVGLTDADIENISQIYIVACGSAYHVGMAAQYVMEDLARIPVRVELASEFRYRRPILDKNALAIIVSQSGETADSLAALREAKEHGGRTLGIVNVVGSSIARVSNQLRVPSKTKPRIVAGFKTSCNGLDIFLEFQAPREAVHPESLNLCHSYVWEFR